jgi:hypothetical protein
MNTKQIKIAIEQAQKVCNEMSECSNKFILQDSINDMNKALNIDIVIKWLPVDKMSDEDWDRAYEEDLMIKFDNGAEGKYSSCWGSAEATHVAV